MRKEDQIYWIKTYTLVSVSLRKKLLFNHMNCAFKVVILFACADLSLAFERQKRKASKEQKVHIWWVTSFAVQWSCQPKKRKPEKISLGRARARQRASARVFPLPQHMWQKSPSRKEKKAVAVENNGCTHVIKRDILRRLSTSLFDISKSFCYASLLQLNQT